MLVQDYNFLTLLPSIYENLDTLKYNNLLFYIHKLYTIFLISFLEFIHRLIETELNLRICFLSGVVFKAAFSLSSEGSS